MHYDPPQSARCREEEAKEVREAIWRTTWKATLPWNWGTSWTVARHMSRVRNSGTRAGKTGAAGRRCHESPMNQMDVRRRSGLEVP